MKNMPRYRTAKANPLCGSCALQGGTFRLRTIPHGPWRVTRNLDRGAEMEVVITRKQEPDPTGSSKGESK